MTHAKVAREMHATVVKWRKSAVFYGCETEPLVVVVIENRVSYRTAPNCHGDNHHTYNAREQVAVAISKVYRWLWWWCIALTVWGCPVGKCVFSHPNHQQPPPPSLPLGAWDRHGTKIGLRQFFHPRRRPARSRLGKAVNAGERAWQAIDITRSLLHWRLTCPIFGR